MKVNITVKRSKAWVAAQRLETGTNVPEEVVVPVQACDLSHESRKVLLQAGNGGYPSTFAGNFNESHAWKDDGWRSFGRIDLMVDDVAPSPAQIDAAILAADARLQAKRTEWEALKESQRQEAARKQAEEDRKAEARELVKAELDALKAERDQLKKKRDVLADFITEAPQDALRGILKSIAAERGRNEAEKLKQEIEDASPWVVFKDGDEDTDD